MTDPIYTNLGVSYKSIGITLGYAAYKWRNISM